MSKLLHANFTRVFKSKSLRIGILFLFGLAIALVLNQYFDATKYNYPVWLEDSFFAIAVLATFPLAVFVPLFLGTEYSDGTMRNKLIVGHTRRNIYFANLITAITSGILLCLAWAIPFLGLSSFLLGREKSWGAILLVFVTILVEVTIFASINTFISMVCDSKAIASALCLLSTVVLLIVGLVIVSRLEQPEFYSGYSVVQDGVLVDGGLEANPDYLPEGSVKRTVYEFLRDFTPGGQALVLSSLEDIRLLPLVIYDCGIFIVLMIAGFIIYKKKDLK